MSIIGITDEVQEAVYEALTGSVSVMALVTGVYEDAPQPAVFPYVTMGETVETKGAVFDKDGRVVATALHVWSQYAGQSEAHQILGVIGDLLDDAALVVDGGVVESCEVEQTQVIRDPDGRTRHGILELRVLVAES